VTLLGNQHLTCSGERTVGRHKRRNNEEVETEMKGMQKIGVGKG
jgi:hypothetical protein